MSKRKYRISGKSFDFNNAKFKSLIENFAKANKVSKRKVYMMLTEKLRLAFDSYKSIEKGQVQMLDQTMINFLMISLIFSKYRILIFWMKLK